MKKNLSLLSGLLLSAALFLGVSSANADSGVLKTPLDLTGYCHMQYPPVRGDGLSWDRPVFDGGSGLVIDFYGSCDYDPLGPDAIRARSGARSRSIYDNDGDDGE